MKHIQTVKLAEILRNQGHKVTLKKRSDGGYLITSINGVKFKGAAGNNRARQMTGLALSEKMSAQRQTAVKNRAEYNKVLDKEIKSQLRETQKAWRERNRSWLNKSTHAKITTRQVAKLYQKTQGDKARVLKMLKESEKYSRGWAYEENVLDLITRLERIRDNSTKSYAQWDEIVKYFKDNIDHIDVNLVLNEIYRLLYNYDEGLIKREESAIHQIKKVIGI